MGRDDSCLSLAFERELFPQFFKAVKSAVGSQSPYTHKRYS